MSSSWDAQPAIGDFSDIVRKFSGAHRTVSELACTVIREAIMEGIFGPGKWLRQEWLAQQLDISRLPIHNALVQLEAEGLVDLYSHRGAKVRTLTLRQVDEIYQIRILLESYALRRSAPKLTTEKLAVSRTLAAQLDNRSALSGAKFLATRIQFYDVLYDAENNPILAKIIAELRSQVGRLLLLSPYAPHRKHVELVDLIAAGDLAGAEEWLTGHLQDVRRGIEPQLIDDVVDPSPAGSA